MAALLLQTESTLTDRYQTTIPDAVRKALHLEKRDKICYTVQSDGHVFLSKVDEIEDDPVINGFLNFITNDMKQNPEHLTAMDQTFVNRILSLVSHVDINLDDHLPNEDELTQVNLNNKRELP